MMRSLLILTLFLSQLVFSQSDDLRKFQLAQSFSNSGNYEKAIALLLELHQKSPQNNEFFTKLNENYLNLKKYDASIKLTENHLKLMPDDVNAYGMLGATYHLMGNEEKAYEIWDKPLDKFSDNHMSYRIIANYALERRAFAKAIELYQRGKDIAPNPVIYSFDLASLYSLTMQYGKAAENYCEILKSNTSQFQVIESKILSYINKPGALEPTLEMLEDCGDEKNLNIKFILSKIYIASGNHEKAIEFFKEIDRIQQTGGLNLYGFAQQLLQEKNYTLAEIIFSEILNEYENSPYLPGSKLGLAKTLEGQLEREFQNVNPDWKEYSRNPVMDIETANEVIRVYSELSETYKGSDVAIESLLRIGFVRYIYLNNEVSAEKYLNQLIVDYPTSQFASDAYLQLGEIALLKGNIVKAKEYFSSSLNSSNTELKKKNLARYKLARVLFYQNNFSEAQKILSEILQTLKDDIANDAIELSLLLNTSIKDTSNLTRFAEAEFLADKREFDKAKGLYEQISANEMAFTLSPVSRLRAVQMEIAKENYTSAVEELEMFASDTEKHIYEDKALYLLGNIYENEFSDFHKAIETFEKLLANYPNSLYLDEAREKIIELRNKTS